MRVRFLANLDFTCGQAVEEEEEVWTQSVALLFDVTVGIATEGVLGTPLEDD